MKPVFANTFNVTHNKGQAEVALSFALTDVSAQVVDEVSSVLLNRDGFIALAKLLNNVCSDWGVDLNQ